MTQKVAGYIRKNTLIERAVNGPVFWVVLVSFVFAVPIWRSIHRELPAELPKIFKVQKLNLTTQFDESFELLKLGNRIAIAHFHDFGCSECSQTLKDMQKIQKRVRGLGSNIALLSINVNENFANTDALKKVSMEYKANPFVWKMLFSSSFDQLQNTVKESFKGPLTVNSDKLIYPKKIYLIDKEGNVRGLYNFEKESINNLMIDVGLLINSAFSKS